ncbi:DUF262 domain-containing protein [candidate division KSB1 bacterium]|nr:MAG: DUF262 domain-containing protein [candidate division KSB1 bacterium]
MSIFSILNQIKNNEVVLPAIQRDFVWTEDKVQMLLDSVMRSYPIGIILEWETYDDIQYRTFDQDYRDDTSYVFHSNTENKRLRIVLDGQQRLQSLYIGLFGTHNGRHLYFDVLSGKPGKDFREVKYSFRFLADAEAQQKNAESREKARVQTQVDVHADSDDEEANDRKVLFLKVMDIYTLGAISKERLISKMKSDLALGDDDVFRLRANIQMMDDALSKDENILKASVIDENLPSDKPERKSESDVLEVFVRINRQGTPLNRSDLIFSMLKLSWRESAVALPEFVKKINEGNSFQLDTDFVMRCLFAVAGLGTKFDVDKLRHKDNIDAIKKNYDRVCRAIQSSVDFVQTQCWCVSSRLLKGYHTLVPFVYYLANTTGHTVPNNGTVPFRKALYLFGFCAPFSRYADSRLNKFINEALKPLASRADPIFPLEKAIEYSRYWERVTGINDDLLNRNPALALSLVQQLSGAKTHFWANAPEIDHIFPRSKLREMDRFSEEEINHFANYWILAKGKNQNKSNQHPKEYFEDVNDGELARACIDRSQLNYNMYRSFMRDRAAKIVEKVAKKLGFNESEFEAPSRTQD